MTGRAARWALGFATLAAALAAACAPALAGPAGADPQSNVIGVGPPAQCHSGTGASVGCVNAVIAVLDLARARLGQPPYALPNNFPTMSPQRQAFILVNLDRGLYGLPPIPGLTDDLNAAAQRGVAADSDPSTGDGSLTSTSNWAGSFADIDLAYAGWMYDDGPGGINADCSAAGQSGCWGHRHDVLWDFGSATLAMGAAAGTDGNGHAGYAMLIAGSASYLPSYSYTWSQAVADGAGTNVYVPVVPSGGSGPPRDAPAGRVALAVRIGVHRVVVRIVVPAGSHPRCSLMPVHMHARFTSCASVTVFTGVRRGRYMLRVRAAGTQVSRAIRMR